MFNRIYIQLITLILSFLSLSYIHSEDCKDQKKTYFLSSEKRYKDDFDFPAIETIKLKEIKDNYPVNEFLSVPPELFILNKIAPFCFFIYNNNEETSERILKGELKYIKGKLRPPASDTVGLIVEKDGEVFLVDREEAREIYTPIDSKEKALALICLLEEVFPIYDLSFLKVEEIGADEEEKEIIYSNIKEGLHPTQIIEEEDYYLINLFFWFVYWTDERLYKIDKNGNIEIIKEERAFNEYIGGVF